LLDLPPDDASLPPDSAITKNAQFVWFGDFLSPLDDIEITLRRLSHSAVAGQLVHIVDPAEEDFPFTGRTRFEDARGAQGETIGRAESIASAYRHRFKAHSEAVGMLARRLGWTHIIHRTDRSPQTALVALYADMSGA
jgi:uncharacterized protein (DUF58 family)